MTDRRKFLVLAGGSVALAVLALADQFGLGEAVGRFSEEGRRRRRFERALAAGKLSLHRAMYWRKL